MVLLLARFVLLFASRFAFFAELSARATEKRGHSCQRADSNQPSLALRFFPTGDEDGAASSDGLEQDRKRDDDDEASGPFSPTSGPSAHKDLSMAICADTLRSLHL